MIPGFLYGTAWKEDRTEELTRLAIEAGFRGIDTANQRRHYFEAGVGAAIAGAIKDGLLRRDELFLQTKFTYIDGQDHRLPYDPHADAKTQVYQSFASSLEHLQVATIDSYVLHGPSRRRGLAAVDLEVWRAMEVLHASGKTNGLGISNVALDQLQELLARASVQPSFVQNRCFARLAWDRDVRVFCREHGIIYQGFSLLTANVRELQHPDFRRIVEKVRKTPAQVAFRFAMQIGILPITGTTDARHMREDLAIHDFDLSEDDLSAIEHIGS
ncbi:MAG TPA: aldo/keto reductase [Thermoanaerobaculia bacterium]|nr:aldo/keto reductase [Thermoanaerobaculia bacterium]